MPLSATDLDEQLLAALAAEPGGLSIDAIAVAMQPDASRRTLQRRLAALVQEQRVALEGRARAARYRLPRGAALQLPALELQARGETYVPISPAGAEIKAYIRRPLQQRRPVSYDMRLLEAYEPGQSAYLDLSLRAQLHLLGRAPVDQAAPAGTFARDILSRLLIDLSWASSQLEGNTYTRLDTERLIDFGQAAEGKDALETQMILNHKAAIEYLVGDPRVAVDRDTLIALHALLSDGLLRDPAAVGRVRQRAVEIGGSVYRPIAMPQRLDELFDIVIRMAAGIADPIEQAFFLMVHLPYLQPFEDVNKRVSRLAANIPLMRHNLSPLSFIDVPAPAYVDGMLGVYELGRVDLLRDVFVWAYERSCQQYVAVLQQLMPPDTFRLRHRAALGAAIATIVQRNLPLDAASLARVTPRAVTKDERPRFRALLQAEFAALHEGNAVRFGLRPLELAAWRQSHPNA